MRFMIEGSKPLDELSDRQIVEMGLKGAVYAGVEEERAMRVMRTIDQTMITAEQGRWFLKALLGQAPRWGEDMTQASEALTRLSEFGRCLRKGEGLNADHIALINMATGLLEASFYDHPERLLETQNLTQPWYCGLNYDRERLVILAKLSDILSTLKLTNLYHGSPHQDQDHEINDFDRDRLSIFVDEVADFAHMILSPELMEAEIKRLRQLLEQKQQEKERLMAEIDEILHVVFLDSLEPSRRQSYLAQESKEKEGSRALKTFDEKEYDDLMTRLIYVKYELERASYSDYVNSRDSQFYYRDQKAKLEEKGKALERCKDQIRGLSYSISHIKSLEAIVQKGYDWKESQRQTTDRANSRTPGLSLLSRVLKQIHGSNRSALVSLYDVIDFKVEMEERDPWAHLRSTQVGTKPDRREPFASLVLAYMNYKAGKMSMPQA